MTQSTNAIQLRAFCFCWLIGAAATTALAQTDDDLREVRLEFDVRAEKTTIPLFGRLWVEAGLTNRGKKPVTVYWGDYAHPAVYGFDATDPDGRKTPSISFTSRPPQAPRAARRKRFRTIKPDERIKYKMVLGNLPGANTQVITFNKPGLYSIDTSLTVTTDHVREEDGTLTPVPNAWTGHLLGTPIAVEVTEQISPHAAHITGDVTLSGKVSAHDKMPLAMASVRPLLRLTGGGGPNGMYWAAAPAVFTDAKGNFHLPRMSGNAIQYRLEVRHAKHPTRIVDFDNDGSKEIRKNVELERPVAVQGRVVSETGKGILDVYVRGYWQETLSNADGSFQLPNLPPRDEYNLSFSSQGYQWQQQKVAAAAAQSGKWKIVMAPASQRELRGVALFPSGEPVRKAKLHAWLHPPGKRNKHAPRRQVETDEEGRFTLEFPESAPHDVCLLAEDMSVDSHLPHNSWESEGFDIAPNDNVVPFEFDNRSSLRVTVAPQAPIPPGVELQVEVGRFRSQEQYNSVPATLWTIGDEPAKAENGRPKPHQWTLDHQCPGRFEVRVFVKNASQLAWEKKVDVVAGQTAAVELSIPTLRFGRLVGKVVPPKDAEFLFHRQHVFCSHEKGSVSIPIDTEGRFEAALPEGRACLKFNDKEYVGSVEGDVKPGESLTLDVKIQHQDDVTGRIRGTVRLSDGKPLIGVGQDLIGIRPKYGPGEFEQRLPFGEHVLSLALPKTPQWKKAAGRLEQEKSPNGFGSFVFAGSQERIFLPVQVRRGVQTVDISIPDQFRDLKMNLKGLTMSPWVAYCSQFPHSADKKLFYIRSAVQPAIPPKNGDVVSLSEKGVLFGDTGWVCLRGLGPSNVNAAKPPESLFFIDEFKANSEGAMEVNIASLPRFVLAIDLPDAVHEGVCFDVRPAKLPDGAAALDHWSANFWTWRWSSNSEQGESLKEGGVRHGVWRGPNRQFFLPKMRPGDYQLRIKTGGSNALLRGEDWSPSMKIRLRQDQTVVTLTKGPEGWSLQK